MNRDLRIDFVRGVVLLLIVADHVMNNERVWLSFADMCFVDAGPVFVFLSGLVCGMVYSRVIDRHGFIAAQKKSLSRCVQLYAAQLVMWTSILGLVLVAGSFENVNVGIFGLEKLFAHPASSLPRVLTLTYLPWLLDILVFYMAILTALPAMLWLYRRSRLAAMGVSFGLYLFAQARPDLSPIEYGSGKPWFWNPFAWQMLFFMGAALGVERKAGTLRLPRSPWLTAVALAGLVGLMWFKGSHTHLSESYHMIDRQRMAPVRVLSLLLIAYLAASVLRSNWSFWRSRWAKPVIRCGQHSLEIFCIGVVIDYAVSLILQALTNPAAEATVIAAGVGLTLLAAWGLDFRARRRSEAAEAIPQPVPAAAASAGGVPLPSNGLTGFANDLVTAMSSSTPAAARVMVAPWPPAGWQLQANDLLEPSSAVQKNDDAAFDVVR